jgi:hypothetical protein
MKSTFRIQAALAAAMLLMGGAAMVKADHNDGQNNNQNNNQIRIRTTLAGAAIQGQKPEGHADFRSEPARGRTQFNVEVEDVNLPAGTTLDVFVQHGAAQTKVGTITLQAGGFGELELNSQDGDSVPPIQKGDMVIVKNNGAAILAGAF